MDTDSLVCEVDETWVVKGVCKVSGGAWWSFRVRPWVSRRRPLWASLHGTSSALVRSGSIAHEWKLLSVIKKHGDTRSGMRQLG